MQPLPGAVNDIMEAIVLCMEAVVSAKLKQDGDLCDSMWLYSENAAVSSLKRTP